ncbi:MAG: hypothetical protein JSV59_04475 [Flavobacteriaceae bacterium]|nr:MAG: hypothetical protein JSV59_04475 [Flavobacteriaceae bacterium]
MSTLTNEPDSFYLRRLSRFIDVVYAVIFFHIMSQYLPHFEEGTWMGKPYGLLSHFYDSRMELLRIIIGSGLALLYWNQSVGIFKHLVRTNYTHAALSLLQLFFVVLFVYFAIADPNLESKSSPALQAASLAIAGFMSVGLWKYAAKNSLIREGMTKEEINQVTKGNLMEPLTAVFNIGLAFVGPMVWTLAWFLLPPIFLWILKKRK